MTAAEVDIFLDGLCEVAERFAASTPWQPVAEDADDEAIIQLAREAQVEYLVTHNVRDMTRAAEFGIRVMRPAEFLQKLKKAT